MNELLITSQQVKDSANKLIKESQLKEILSVYGEVVIGGSYALDVMLRPDLDIYVLTENDNENQLKKVINGIIATHCFDNFWFADWVNKNAGKIKGYYLQPHKKIDNLNWKLDIWLMKKSEYKPIFPKFLKLLQKEYDNKKRVLILELKDTYKEGTKYRKGIDGNLIYEAVLQKGINSVEEFKIYLKTINFF